MIYYVDGPYLIPYMVMADSEQDALNKCIEYEQTMYDSWASSGFDDEGNWYEDPWPYESEFMIITENLFNTYSEYNDLVNYDFKKCYWGSKDFCEVIKI